MKRGENERRKERVEGKLERKKRLAGEEEGEGGNRARAAMEMAAEAVKDHGCLLSRTRAWGFDYIQKSHIIIYELLIYHSSNLNY